MAETKIEWADYTFNPWIGCEKVSAGCKNCYASVDTYARVSASKGLPLWGPGSARHRTSKANWAKVRTWNRRAREERRRIEAQNRAGVLQVPYRRPRVFCASLADVFEGRADLDPIRAELWPLIEECDELDWLLLTKRPENVLGMAPLHWLSREYRVAPGERRVEAQSVGWPSHVWVGTSVEDQAAADTRIPHLLAVPAPVRFLSMEPLLGPVDLTRITTDRDTTGPIPFSVEFDALRGFCGRTPEEDTPAVRGLQWVIVGGESGPNARPMHPDWVRSIRDQCQAAGVPFLFKQWGEFKPNEFGNSGRYPMVRMGKKAAGRVLDGRTWDEFPRSGT